mmetsp:Transcript_45457/g.72696  ORF Transcript_45457/g.72696 Transcript_45457/m.72696 type:complete len:363 (-) Transcript_45457:117-1205(-)
MIRNPSIAKNGKPELNEEEEFLYELTLCGIEFGELTGNGTFYVTTQRIVWINTSPSSSEDTTCYSFSSLLIHLMIHALCKEPTSPYLFLQVENQEDDIKIMHKSFDELQAGYHALCEGQRLNPCEGDSDDAGDAFMAFGGDADHDDNEEKQEQARQDYIATHWDSKLILNDEQQKHVQDAQQQQQPAPMVNNNGYLEPAKKGQFDDAEFEHVAMAEDAESAHNDRERESDERDNDEPEEIDIDQILSLGLNKMNDYSDKKRTGSISGVSASFDPFHFAENLFDSKPSTPTKRRKSKTVTVQEKSSTEGDNENPYLDPNVLRGFDQFAPQQNKSFESKYKSYKELQDGGDAEVDVNKKKDADK